MKHIVDCQLKICKHDELGRYVILKGLEYFKLRKRQKGKEFNKEIIYG